MKILHLVHVFPPESRGGTEFYVLRLATAQRDAGDDVLVLSGSDHGPLEPEPRREGEPREETVEGVRVLRRGPPDRRAMRLAGRDGGARRLLQELLRRERPDILHVHHWHNGTTDAVATAREEGVPAVVTLHDLFATCPLFFRLPDDVRVCRPELPREACVACLVSRGAGDGETVGAGLREREAALRAELEEAAVVLAVSEPARDFLAAVPMMDGIAIRLLSLPRTTPPAAPPTARPRATPGRLRLVSWGGLVPGKGLHLVLDACEALPATGAISLDHYGPGFLPSYTQRLRITARRTRLTLHGPVPFETIAAHLHRFDLAVFPSLYLETHGFVVDEALDAGLPVVVSDRGAPARRVGHRGVVFPAENPSTLRPILEGFLRDPASLDALRDGAPAPRASLQEHRDALSRIYEEARAVRAEPRLRSSR